MIYYEKQFDKWFLFLVAAAAGLLFLHLGAAPVYILDEAKNAQCAREMWLRNDWIVPTFNGELRTDKPALHYWFMILSYKVFGFGEWQARLFSALAGVGTIIITHAAVRRWIGSIAAFFAALALTLSTHFIFEFRLAVPDPYLIFFTTAGLLAGFGYLTERKFSWLIMCAAALALATLAKGPVALGLPGICILSFVIMRRQWWVLRDWRLLVAAVVYAAIALPWYYQVHVATDGAFTKGFFLDHNINRFSSEMEGHGGPFIITPLIVLVGLLPFTVLIGSLVSWYWKMYRRPGLLVYAVIVSLVYIIFFSVSSTKLPNYPMPCYAFVAIALGVLLEAWWNNEIRWPKYTWWILLVIGIGLVIGGWLGIGAEKDTAHLKPLSLGLLVLPLGIGYILAKRERTRRQVVVAISATYLLFTLFVVAFAYPILYRQNPVSRIAPVLNEPGTKVLGYRIYNPAVNFNLDKGRVELFTDESALAAFCHEQEKENGRILLVTREEYLEDLKDQPWKVLESRRDLFELPTTVLLEWRP